jgi:hypothetical protein
LNNNNLTPKEIFQNWGETKLIEDSFNWNGERINTITSSPKILSDNLGNKYYEKSDHLQNLQFQYLSALNLPVPKFIANLTEDTFITIESGIPLQDILAINRLSVEEKKKILECVGKQLRNLEYGLDEIDAALPSEVVFTSYIPTAHIVRSFLSRYYFNEGDSFSNIKKISLGFSGTINDLLHKMQEISENYLNLINIKDLDKCDIELFYGDIKPENILIKQNNSWEVTFVDPTISRGSHNFDNAKFISRMLLEPEINDCWEYIGYFYEGYGSRLDLNSIAYANLKLRDLIKIDTLNVLTSYTTRHLQGDNNYRLVRLMNDEGYLKRIIDNLDL